MFYIVLIFLWTSVLLYAIMGGADFGAGIIELFSTKRTRARVSNVMYKAIGPIWEANHMWLIITVVILFVGFPGVYTTAATYLHIPIVIMLMGIVARGTAFGFRHYDAVNDKMQMLYSKVYLYSSFITPLFLGIIAGSVISHRIDTTAVNFSDAYIFSWLGIFPVLVGLFTIAIFGFLAAIFIIKETDSIEEKTFVINKAKQMSFAGIILATLIITCAYIDHIPFVGYLFGNPLSITCIVLAMLSLVWLWISLFKRNTRYLRIVAGAQVTLLFIAIAYSYYPSVITVKNGEDISLFNSQANDKTIHFLGSALLFAGVFILPSLAYLLYGFSKKKAW